MVRVYAPREHVRLPPRRRVCRCRRRGAGRGAQAKWPERPFVRADDVQRLLRLGGQLRRRDGRRSVWGGRLGLPRLLRQRPPDVRPRRLLSELQRALRRVVLRERFNASSAGVVRTGRRILLCRNALRVRAGHERMRSVQLHARHAMMAVTATMGTAPRLARQIPGMVFGPLATGSLPSLRPHALQNVASTVAEFPSPRVS